MKIRFIKEYEIEEEDELEAMIKAEGILVKEIAKDQQRIQIIW